MNLTEEADRVGLGQIGAVEPLANKFSLITRPKPLVI